MRKSFKAALGSSVVAAALGFVGTADAAIVEVDQLRVYRGGSPIDWLAGTSGTLILDDHMDNGDPLSGPLFTDGSASLYSVRSLRDAADINKAVSEVGGNLVIDPQYALASSNASNTGAGLSLGVRLGTDTSNADRGLSRTTSFAVGAAFLYQAPAVGYSYGVRLTDAYSNSSDIVDLRIANNGTQSYIYLRHQDFAGGTIADYSSVVLDVPVGASYLGLGLAQITGGSGLINGYYAFSDKNGVLLGDIVTIGSTTIFNGEDHTQFELRALAPVPEPESYAMLLAGLGLVGAFARRYRRTPR